LNKQTGALDGVNHLIVFILVTNNPSLALTLRALSTWRSSGETSTALDYYAAAHHRLLLCATRLGRPHLTRRLLANTMIDARNDDFKRIFDVALTEEIAWEEEGDYQSKGMPNPMSVRAFTTDVEQVKMLLAHGAVDPTADNNAAVRLAITAGMPHMLSTLLEDPYHRVDPGKLGLSSTRWDGSTEDIDYYEIARAARKGHQGYSGVVNILRRVPSVAEVWEAVLDELDAADAADDRVADAEKEAHFDEPPFEPSCADDFLAAQLKWHEDGTSLDQGALALLMQLLEAHNSAVHAPPTL